jgi:hypothetical protein
MAMSTTEKARSRRKGKNRRARKRARKTCKRYCERRSDPVVARAEDNRIETRAYVAEAVTVQKIDGGKRGHLRVHRNVVTNVTNAGSAGPVVEVPTVPRIVDFTVTYWVAGGSRGTLYTGSE